MPPFVSEYKPQMIVRLGVIGLDSERLLVARHRIASFSRRAIRFSQVAVGVRIGGSWRDGLFRMGDGAADAVDSLAILPRAMRDRAQQVQRVDVRGIGDEGLAIGLLRFG